VLDVGEEPCAGYTKTPFTIEIAPETITVEAGKRLLSRVPSEGTMRLPLGILEREQPESAVIFCNTNENKLSGNRLKIMRRDIDRIIKQSKIGLYIS
jgi:ATP-dependent RNA helicase RhlB